MPGKNGTGPEGRGPFTGKGRGFCQVSLKYPETYYGLGYGRRFRPGRTVKSGRGYRFFQREGAGMSQRYEYYNSESFLRDEKAALEERLEYINQKLSEMPAE